MAKYQLRIRARELRRRGGSINVIAKSLGVSKSSVSLWARDIALSRKQLEQLKRRELTGAEKGRIKAAKLKREATKRKQQVAYQQGLDCLDTLSKRDLLILGISLYWAEGSKKDNRIRFCNSDVRMIKIFMLWLKTLFSVVEEDLSIKVGINELHRKREPEVKRYWSKQVGIPLNQFRKTSFKKVKNKKIYENSDKHYGTLNIELLKPGEKRYKIYGLVEALANMAV